MSIAEIKVDMENPRANLAVEIVDKLAVTWENFKAEF
jgi:hypothetical protein